MPVSDFTPGRADLGAVMRSRTIDPTGAETGTFGTTTRPTGVEVDILLESAAKDVSLYIGRDIESEFWDDAQRAAVYRAAMLVELGSFGEQTQFDPDAYERYKTLYEEMIGTNNSRGQFIAGPLVRAILEGGTDDLQTEEAAGAGMPYYRFPPDSGGMLGWGTVW